MRQLWQTRRSTLDLSSHGLIMGVLNVTPDSFSDGGRFLDVEPAVAHGLAMAGAGAGVIDVGGESTRPGAAPVPAGEQVRRVVPVIRQLRERSTALLSIDTTSAVVARAALDAGADIVNDVSGLRGDPEMARVCAGAGCGVIVMHMQGEPATMQQQPSYRDVVAEVREFLASRLEAAVTAGVSPLAIAFDPGIGFGKSLEHNLSLLRHLGRLSPDPGRPLALGVSRKSFLGRLVGSGEMADREWGTVALTSLSREFGARIFRVHDVLPNVHALRMTEAILSAGS